jgi:hypothetical protein
VNTYFITDHISRYGFMFWCRGAVLPDSIICRYKSVMNIMKVVNCETMQQDCHTANLVEDIHGTFLCKVASSVLRTLQSDLEPVTVKCS